ncbi:MAG: hypothetical protein RIQ60_3104 [Pseudomonadota bacterium]|jgi:Zn-dependent protease with chaperone function
MNDPEPGSAPLRVHYCDGQSPRVHAAWLSLDGDALRLHGASSERHIPLAGLRWPERQRHGARLLELDDGASIRCDDAAAWDALAARAGQRDGVVVRLQQSWSRVALALALVVGLLGSALGWGIPLAGQALTALVPVEVDRRLGDAALQQLDRRWLQPSRLAPVEQQRLRELAQQAVARTWRDDAELTTGLVIEFRHAGGLVNAFALPGGRIVVTDALVELVAGRDDIFIGVLGHEAGHARHRHATRMLAQASLVGAGTALLFGDLGSWLAAAPALLGELAYSRDLEREADARSLDVLQANQLGGQSMIDFFQLTTRSAPTANDTEATTSTGGGSSSSRTPPAEPGASTSAGRRDRLAALLSSHPVDEERIAFFHARR